MSRILSHISGWYEVSDERSRLISMEGTRGLAVLLVFFVHFHALFNSYLAPGSPAFGASHFMGLVGNTGVDLFFVISGYLIYGAVIRRRSSYARFVRRRVERIYPTFLAVFCLYLLLSWVFPAANKIHGSWTSEAWYILQNILLLPGIFNVTPIITVAWSLSYEFFFYLSLPLLVLITALWRWRPQARALFFGLIGATYLVGSTFLPRAHVRLTMFVSGILLYEALNSATFRRRLNRRGEIGAVVLFLVSLVVAYLLDTRGSWFNVIPGWTHGRSTILGVPGYQGPYKTAFLGVSCFWLTAYCFGYAGWLYRVFCWTPLRCLGNMSYSYYLIHGAALQGVAALLHRLVSAGPRSPILYVAVLVAGFGATWIASSALFLLVEKPVSLSRRAARQGPAARTSAGYSYWQQQGAAESVALAPAAPEKPGGILQ